MPDPNRPRRPQPPAHPGFEVVEDEPAPPKPASKPVAKPAPRPVPPPTAKAATPPAGKATPPATARPAPKPAFEVVDDTELEEQAKTATTPSRKPVRAAAARDEDDDEDDRPRKKKKKKGGKAKTAEEHSDDIREQRLKEFEYTWPTVLLLLGMGMALAGAIGSAGAGGILSVLVILLGLLVTVPLTIVGLMVVGMVCGINYGRFAPAIIKIAAITFITNGIYFIGEWFKVPLFIIGPIAGSVSFGLFKALFDLDNQETGTSMGALNVMSFLMKMGILLVLAMVMARKDGRSFDPGDYDDDDDPVPTDTRRDSGRGKFKPPPVLVPGDEPDDDE